MRMEEYGKIDLHLHLDGSLSAETLLKLAQRDDIELPADTPQGLRPFLTVKRDCESLNEYLKCFDLPLAVLQSNKNLSLAAYELGIELSQKGLCYGEIRFAPQLHRQRGLTQAEAVKAVLSGLHRAVKESNIRLKAILCCMRGEEVHEANMETVQTAAHFLGKGVVAVDLAGDRKSVV